MKKFSTGLIASGFAAAIAFSSLPTASSACVPFSGCPNGFGTGELNFGVLCRVSDVTVLAATTEDCTKLNGKTTHTVTSTAKPVE